ncbi:MAG: DUF362 domain-containing protein [bacterium]|nr:DUF362 domain-containing protein [bacterium]
MNRRQFLARGAHAALGLALASRRGLLHAAAGTPTAPGAPRPLDFSVPPSASLPQIVVVTGDRPAEMVRKAVDAIGGIGRFVSRGDRVVIKPNASWDRTPEQGANTDPGMAAALTEISLKAGAREVVAIDHTLGEPRRCLERSGIGPAVTRAGGRIRFQGERVFREVDTEGAGVGSWPVMVPLLEADRFINVPVVKQHGLSALTAAMKNLFGVLGGSRFRLHPAIDESITDMAAFVRPTLVILDATRVMVRNGPSGGRADDLIHPRTIAAGTDQVALDAFAASLLGLRPEEVGHVRRAHERGLGTMHYTNLRILRIAA